MTRSVKVGTAATFERARWLSASSKLLWRIFQKNPSSGCHSDSMLLMKFSNAIWHDSGKLAKPGVSLTLVRHNRLVQQCLDHSCGDITRSTAHVAVCRLNEHGRSTSQTRGVFRRILPQCPKLRIFHQLAQMVEPCERLSIRVSAHRDSSKVLAWKRSCALAKSFVRPTAGSSCRCSGRRRVSEDSGSHAASRDASVLSLSEPTPRLCRHLCT